MIIQCVDIMIKKDLFKKQGAGHTYKKDAWGCVKERHLAWGTWNGGHELFSTYCPKQQYSLGVLKFSLAITRILRLLSQGNRSRNKVTAAEINIREVPPLFRKWLSQSSQGGFAVADFPGDPAAECVWEEWAAEQPKYKKSKGGPNIQVFEEMSRQGRM